MIKNGRKAKRNHGAHASWAFEIYYGRKSNQLVKAWLDCVDRYHSAKKKRKLAGHLKKIKKVRRKAKLYSKKLNDQTTKSYKRRHKAETFIVKEHVLVPTDRKKEVNVHQKKVCC